MNNCTFTGRLVRDGAEKMTGGGLGLVFFTMLVSEKGKRAKTLFLDCTLFGDKAKGMGEILKKGKSVFVSGSVWNSTYKSKAGTVVHKIELRATEVKIIDGLEKNGGKEDETPDETEDATEEAPSESVSEAPKEEQKTGEAIDIGTDNLPF